MSMTYFFNIGMNNKLIFAHLAVWDLLFWEQIFSFSISFLGISPRMIYDQTWHLYLSVFSLGKYKPLSEIQGI